jgi:CBS domain-containing protein
MTPVRRPCCPLDLRVRSVIDGEGHRTEESTVSCPRQGRSIALEACLACEHSGGTSAARDYAFALCRAAAAERALDEEIERTGTPHTVATSTPISEVMSVDVVCVRPELAIESVSALLLDRGFSGVPVVDAEGRPVGMVSKTDLVRELAEAPADPSVWVTRKGRAYHVERGSHVVELPRATVAEVMTPLSFSLPESAVISQAAALMAFEDVHRVPVVSEDGKVVGIVTSLDIVAWLARHDGYLVRVRRPKVHAGESLP